jgi:hypothetical protein
MVGSIEFYLNADAKLADGCKRSHVYHIINHIPVQIHIGEVEGDYKVALGWCARRVVSGTRYRILSLPCQNTVIKR